MTDIWIAATLPGETLHLGASGKTWFLGNRPVQTGDRLELLTEGEVKRCTYCDGAGWPEAEQRVVPLAPKPSGRRAPAATFSSCGACDARGYLFLPVWLSVKFEAGTEPGPVDASGHSTLQPVALLHPRLPGISERLSLTVRPRDPIRCRWPVTG